MAMNFNRLALAGAVLSFAIVVVGVGLVYLPAAVIIAGAGPLALFLDHLRGNR